MGRCVCLSPVYSDGASARVTNQLISNRITPDVSWLLEPWSTGPPYSLVDSYRGICDLLLDRLGCPDVNKKIVANTAKAAVGSNFKCSCGKMTTADASVTNVIVDQVNKYNLQVLPIFSNPVYLSVPLSICMVLILGKLGAIVAQYLKIPAIVGYILVGLGIQNFLNPMILKGPGFPFPSLAGELRLLSLTLVLMRAGLAVDVDDVLRNKVSTFVMAYIPYLCEFFVFLYVGRALFGWTVIQMGLWASCMAALGPAVVLPCMLQLMTSAKTNYGYVPKQVLISTPIEAVSAVVLFSIFALLNTAVVDPLYPWVKPLPLYANCLLIPVNLLFSTIMGIIVGYMCSLYINYRIKIKSDFLWERINKNPQLGSSTADLVFVIFVSSYTMISLCTKQYIQQSSGVLVVFASCVTMGRFLDAEVAKDIAMGFKSIWVFAEVFLFTFVGTNLTLDSNNGPLIGERGMSGHDLGLVVACMFAGSLGRLFGNFISCLPNAAAFPPHRRNVKYMALFSVDAWIFQLPKATVQATLGGMAYNMHLFPGSDGLNKGLIISQSAAFTILIFASLGAVLTPLVGAPIAAYLAKLDEEAGWMHAKNRYAISSPYYTGQVASGTESDKEGPEEEEGEVVEVEIVRSRTGTVEHAGHIITRRRAASGYMIDEDSTLKDAETIVDTFRRLRSRTLDPSAQRRGVLYAGAPVTEDVAHAIPAPIKRPSTAPLPEAGASPQPTSVPVSEVVSASASASSSGGDVEAASPDSAVVVSGAESTL